MDHLQAHGKMRREQNMKLRDTTKMVVRYEAALGLFEKKNNFPYRGIMNLTKLLLVGSFEIWRNHVSQSHIQSFEQSYPAGSFVYRAGCRRAE
jgi:hypothetical protein